VGALGSAVASADTATERETAQLRLADLLRSRNEEDKAKAIYERLAAKAMTPHVKQRAARVLSELKGPGKDAAGK
jgi:lipopolysaccharide biosynthesis regulator YciM